MSQLKPKWSILSPELLDEFESLPTEKQADWLFLYPHPTIARTWEVECLDPGFFYDFEDIVGPWCWLPLSKVLEFEQRCDELGYNVVFTEDPTPIFTWREWLRTKEPLIPLRSDFPNTKSGLLPFQLEGFNYLMDAEYGGNCIWSTGTGKTAFVAAMILNDWRHQLAIVVVKKNNKRDMQKKLRQLGGIDSVIVQGTVKQREQIYFDTLADLANGLPAVLICNYEKFRDDTPWMKELIEDRKVVIFWDEMSSKLSNASNKLYKSVLDVLFSKYTYATKTFRAAEIRQYQITATPIENNPVDQFNCNRLINPTLWPKSKDWYSDFVLSYDYFSHKPKKFKNLEKMRLMLEPMTHQVDKSDPEVAEYFPTIIEDPQYIDWHPKDWEIYQIAQELAKDEFNNTNGMALMRVLQMLCDEPEIVNASAENRAAFLEELSEMTEKELEELDINTIPGSGFALDLLERVGTTLTSKNSAKLDRLRDLLEKHKDEKILLFSTWGKLGMPFLERHLEGWGISFRSYRGTEKQMEVAKAEWRENLDIQVLLLSDAGSDSIDLPEASVVIHYNLPVKWSKLIQRQNRAHRLNSKHGSVIYYMLIMADSVEERIIEIISKKLGYHFTLFKEGASELLEAATLDKGDLWYLLTGQAVTEQYV